MAESDNPTGEAEASTASVSPLPSGAAASSPSPPESASSGGPSPPQKADGAEEGEEGGQKPLAPPPPKGDEEFAKKRLQARVDKLTAQKKALEAQLVAKQAGGGAPSPQDEEAIQRLVEQRADALAEQRAANLVAKQSFSKAQQDVMDEGFKIYGREEFDSRVKLLKQIRDDDDPVEMAQYTKLIAAVIETGEAPKLIHMLSSDLELATRLMGLSDIKMGMEIAKLSVREPPEGVSTVAKPITPIGNRGRSHEPLKSEAPEGDRLSTAEWMRRRMAHAEQVNKESGRRLL